MARRKIVLVIVEGPSDADSLELYFSKFFDSNTVHMKIMYGDITSKRGINQSNIKARLGMKLRYMLKIIILKLRMFSKLYI